MKRTYIIYSMVLIAMITSFMVGCRKDDTNLDVDLTQYNYDDFEKGPIDDYIEAQLRVPYNIEVVYRFDRSHTNVARDISPPIAAQVPIAVDMIRKGFIDVYATARDNDFIRQYTPKQFVLFGSHQYNPNGTITLGTADGGRRVVLYDVNNIDPSNYTDIKRRLRTIHHEFTHILNQIVPIPPAFQVVTTDYVADWTAGENTEQDAIDLGFVSRYARDSYGEDFAEMVAHLLVEGQAWFDRRVAASTTDGRAKLRLKESIILDYFERFLEIDFKKLQYEFYVMASEIYGDPTEAAVHLLRNNNIASINVDYNNAFYTTWGNSQAAVDVFQAANDNMGGSGRTVASYNVAFPSSEIMQLQVSYSNAAGSTFTAWYDFNVSVDANGIIRFEYFNNSTDNSQYNNGRVILNFMQPLIDYYNDYEFEIDWLDIATTGYNNFLRYANLGVVGDDSNYVYGLTTLK